MNNSAKDSGSRKKAKAQAQVDGDVQSLYLASDGLTAYFPTCELSQNPCNSAPFEDFFLFAKRLNKQKQPR